MVSWLKIIFAGLFGILYMLSGLVMILTGVIQDPSGLAVQSGIPADPIGGFVLCVVGAVFLSAGRKLAGGSMDGHAFLYVGMALSAIFGIVALLSIGAQGVEVLLFGEGEPWDPARLAVPMLYLALVPAAGLYAWGRGFLSDLTGS